MKIFSEQLSSKVLIYKFDNVVCLQTKVLLKNFICDLAFIKEPCINFWKETKTINGQLSLSFQSIIYNILLVLGLFEHHNWFARDLLALF